MAVGTPPASNFSRGLPGASKVGPVTRRKPPPSMSAVGPPTKVMMGAGMLLAGMLLTDVTDPAVRMKAGTMMPALKSPLAI
jgi:hypothetical protein